MRRWLIVLLVLLLPLRALVGEAMAGQMLQQHAAAMATAVDAASAAPAAGHDCDHHPRHHAQAEPAEEPPAAEGMQGDCPTCASCQVCSSVALSPSVQAPAAMHATQAPPLTVQRAYPSAEPALAFKPPRA